MTDPLRRSPGAPESVRAGGDTPTGSAGQAEATRTILLVRGRPARYTGGLQLLAPRERVGTEPTAEEGRLADQQAGTADWRRWGPYVSDREWGTVREDYSADGDAWTYFPHDHARSRAYRWGEDGLAGWCDRYQLLVFAVALWNGRDAILKERLFGLTPREAHHGEDVKEYYFHVDATPTHSYQRFLYKYPHGAYPYGRLLDAHRGRSTMLPEVELLDTGVFEGSRYFDVTVEYAKAGPEDTCVRIAAVNRGPEPAELHLLPQLWFRNRWAWGPEPRPIPRI